MLIFELVIYSVNSISSTVISFAIRLLATLRIFKDIYDSKEIDVDSFTIPIEFEYAIISIAANYNGFNKTSDLYFDFLIQKNIARTLGINTTQTIGGNFKYDGVNIIRAIDKACKIKNVKVLVFS